MSDVIYLDHGATTRLHPKALEAMLPWLQESFANPSSLYAAAREARAAIEEARADVAEILGCRPTEIIFTSGGTESVNAALRGIGLAQQRARSGRKILTTSIEHHAVLHTCQQLESLGFETYAAGVDSGALVSLDDLIGAVGAETALVTVMLANNEVGTIQPIQELARHVHRLGAKIDKRIPVHTDAVAAAGYLPIDVNALEVDALSLAAHKFGGPKGAGILYLRRAVPFLAQQTGGGQEHQRRAGTEDVAGIVGTAVALRLATSARPVVVPTLERLRDQLIAGVLGAIPDAALNGHPSNRLAGNANFRLPGAHGEALLAELDAAGIAASSGSACADASWEPSHVVLAMGYTLADAASSLRFTLGPETSQDEVDRVISVLPRLVEHVRAIETPVSART